MCGCRRAATASASRRKRASASGLFQRVRGQAAEVEGEQVRLGGAEVGWHAGVLGAGRVSLVLVAPEGRKVVAHGASRGEPGADEAIAPEGPKTFRPSGATRS